jgi:hypothetical protein
VIVGRAAVRRRPVEASLVPRSEGEVTAAWLDACLADRLGSPVTDVQVARLGATHGLASRIVRVAWSGPHAAGYLVVKLWSTEDVPGPGEVGFFRDLAERVVCPMPFCLLAAIDHDGGRGVLVLEDLSHLEQGDSTSDLPLPRARSLVHGLAGLHGPWWDDPGLQEASWLRVVPHAWGTDWFLDRRARFVARFGDRLDGFTGPLLARIEGPYAAAREHLAAAPQTLVHGDLHLDNTLIDPATDQVVLLDWARVARGPAAVDLAQALFVMARDGDRATLLQAYLDALADRGLSVEREELEGQLAAAVIVLFVTWTCAVARWEPASERERRILDVAVARALRSVHAMRAAILRVT